MNQSAAVPATPLESLGLPFGVWLFLTLLFWFALFFKFHRFWSIRNLDLVLMLAQLPALLHLTTRDDRPASAFALLFVGLGIWLVRCVLDLALTRRPVLEPNLDSAGLGCLMAGLLALVAIEAITVPIDAGVERNPGDPHSVKTEVPTPASDATLRRAFGRVAPSELKRLMAALGHVGISLGLVGIGSRIFQRPTIGLGMAVAFLILPYTRIALIDSGQLVAAALVVLAIAAYRRPATAGLALAVAGAWMPPVAGLIPAWAGFYWGRGVRRFVAVAVPVLVAAWLLASTVPAASRLAVECGARTLNEVGLLPSSESPAAGSFWNDVEPAYRLPVLVLHLCVVALSAVWPAEKNLGQLIAQSALLLIASEFWYLDQGGTHATLYVPLLLLLTFRPNLSLKRPPEPPRPHAAPGS
ncbi:MAG: hypothetical protein KatS3mg108_3741 [Isosphaeraceae bacterium]|nr:MAG: hypothetical protein KatS3mg108_3741 [Isosphaeraceae bacterium]